MKKLILSALLAVAALGIVATEANAQDIWYSRRGWSWSPVRSYYSYPTYYTYGYPSASYYTYGSPVYSESYSTYPYVTSSYYYPTYSYSPGYTYYYPTYSWYRPSMTYAYSYPRTVYYSPY